MDSTGIGTGVGRREVFTIMATPPPGENVLSRRKIEKTWEESERIKESVTVESNQVSTARKTSNAID